MSNSIDDGDNPIFIQKLDTDDTQEIMISAASNNSIGTLKRAWHYANGVLLRRRNEKFAKRTLYKSERSKRK